MFCYRDVIDWKDARRKLFWRLKRRLHEKKLMSRIENTGSNLNHGQKTELIRRWFTENQKSKEESLEKFVWEDDKPVAEWLESQIKDENTGQVIKDNLKLMRVESMMSQFRKLISNMNDDELQEGGIYLAQKLSPAKKEEFAEAIAQIESVPEDATDDGDEAKQKNIEAKSGEDKQKDDSSASE